MTKTPGQFRAHLERVNDTTARLIEALIVEIDRKMDSETQPTFSVNVNGVSPEVRDGVLARYKEAGWTVMLRHEQRDGDDYLDFEL